MVKVKKLLKPDLECKKEMESYPKFNLPNSFSKAILKRIYPSIILETVYFARILDFNLPLFIQANFKI
jgi:hypothetical protein